MASPSPMKFHVLLVDSDMDNLVQTQKLLQFNSIKVSVVREISSSSSMLSKDGVGVDIVMVNPNAFNPLGFINFVRDAVQMGAIVILMCNKASASQVKCAIEDGVFLVMEKPITFHDIKYLWQYVMREKTIKSITGKSSIGEAKSPSFSLSMGKQGMPMRQDNITMMNKAAAGGPKGTVEYLNFGSHSTSNDNSSGGGNKRMKRKMCMTWEPHIHQKFVNAVQKLGDGKCFPKDIVELMNVPGLTRMQVASHLQKCRGPSAEYQRKALLNSSKSQTSNKRRRFGISPLITEDSQNIQKQEGDNNMEQFYWPPNFGVPNYDVNMGGSQEAGAPNVVNMGPQQEVFGNTFSMSGSMPSGNLIGHISAAPPVPVPIPAPVPRSGPEIDPVQQQGLQIDFPLDIPIAEEFDLQFFNLEPYVNVVKTWPDGGAEDQVAGDYGGSLWEML